MSIASKVELAPGADPLTNSGGWMFTDYSSFALGQVDVAFGRSDEAGTMQPARLVCRLRNNDGRFTYLRRGTPLRYSVNPGAGFTQLFQGFIDEVIPAWPAGNSTVAEVSITASGALRRLQQGSPVIQSAIYRSTIRAPGLVKYASLEEDSGSTRLSTIGFRSQQNALFGGTITCAGETTLGGAKQACVLTDSSYLKMDVSPRPFGGHWQNDWFYKFTGSNPAAETIVMRTWTDNPAAQIIDAVYGGGNWGLRVYSRFGVVVASSIFAPPTGQATGWWHWRVTAHDGGSGNTDYLLEVHPVPLATGFTAPLTIAGTPGNLASGVVLPNAALSGVGMCHWALYDQFNFSAVDASGAGYDGEVATTRLARLCREESIEITVTGASSVTMGPQKPAPTLQLLRDCEAADGGVLRDGYGAGLAFLGETSRYNRGPTMALNADVGQVKLPFGSTKDDAGLTNDWTITNPAGASAQASDEDNVAVNNRYANTATVNLRDAGQLQDLASWKVHVGTVDELRVPQLQLELVDRPELWTSAFLLRPGHPVTVDNLLDQFPPGQLGVIAQGIQATVDATSWRMAINCSPKSPYDVGLLDSNPLDSDASVVGTALTATATSMDVLVSDGQLWDVTDGPFNIKVGGNELAPPEVMRVTAASAATTPTPALVAVGTASAADGSGSPTVTPGIPGGATAAGNLLLMFASCRDTNAVDTDMFVSGAPAWQKIVDGVNFAFFAKVHSGTETAPTVGHSSLIAGDTMIAQIASFTGKWGDPKTQLVAVAQQLNAAAQNIAYPELPITLGGVLLVWAGWKADDWTSVATLGGITEISEATSTLGNDAGQVWDYNTSAGTPVVVGGSFVVTGGTSQISRGCVLALRSVYQTLTVTRAQGGTTARTHALGEAVHVTNPLTLTRQ